MTKPRAPRHQLGTQTSVEMKRYIERRSEQTGQSQSRIIELLLEKGIAIERAITALERLAKDGDG